MHYRWAAVSLLTAVLLTGESAVQAKGQDTPNLPIFSFEQGLASDMTWTTDSRWLIFRDGAFGHGWFTYEVQTGILSQYEERPMPPDLNADTLTTFTRITGVEQDKITFYSLSPNQRYLAYMFNAGKQLNIFDVISFPGTGLGLLNTEDSEHVIIDTNFPNNGTLIWSDNSAAFAVRHTLVPNDLVIVHYATQYSDSLSGFVLRDLWNGIHINGADYTVNGAYDLTADGESLLIRVNVSDDQTRYQLYMYNGLLPSGDRLINTLDATHVVAASFAPGDESRLWLLNETGIVEYSLETGNMQILKDAFKSGDASAVTMFDPAVFSPNGLYLATQGSSGLYLIDLTNMAHNNTSAEPEVPPVSEPPGWLRLQLALECPAKPGETLVGWVRNPNPDPLTVTWREANTSTSGTLIVPGGSPDAPGEATFTIAAEPETNRLAVFVDGVFHDQRSCFVPREG